jgi:hypothetical protein
VDLKEFYPLVVGMRKAQISYFQSRSLQNLDAAKKAERAVDEWIAEYQNPQHQLFEKDG